MISRLQTISDAIKQSADRAEKERQEQEKSLGKPVFFIEDVENKNQGVGYFQVSSRLIYAYRKYDNGYERYPCAIFDKTLVDKLHKVFHSK